MLLRLRTWSAPRSLTEISERFGKPGLMTGGFAAGAARRQKPRRHFYGGKGMCERWWCCFNMSRDCSLPTGEVCQYEEEDEESKAYDDLGDMIYHQKVDEEICHV